MHRLNIAIGNFFFRYRNALFPLVLTIGALTLRPTIMFDNLVADRILRVFGVILALLGEGVRIITIGFEYIHRGGKDGQVYAGYLVRRGVYGITRNPMYVGNALMAIGMILLFGSPWADITLIPFFLFVYQAIVAAEENYLRNKFGAEYSDYEHAVNRYLPAISRVAESFSGMRFNWRRSIRQEMGTMVGFTIGFILISVWRTYYLRGIEPAKSAAAQALWLCLGITLVYLFLIRLKKSKKLFKESADLQN